MLNRWHGYMKAQDHVQFRHVPHRIQKATRQQPLLFSNKKVDMQRNVDMRLKRWRVRIPTPCSM